MADQTNYFTELIVSITVGLGAIMYGIQSLLKNWKIHKTESSLLKMMHEELERMSSQNTTLSYEIGKLQGELVTLSTQLSGLTKENQKLQVEVASLNNEISRLHSLMVEKTGLKEVYGY
jgi:peptidoglycan hydrolase CwlO-like protein